MVGEPTGSEQFHPSFGSQMWEPSRPNERIFAKYSGRTRSTKKNTGRAHSNLTPSLPISLSSSGIVLPPRDALLPTTPACSKLDPDGQDPGVDRIGRWRTLRIVRIGSGGSSGRPNWWQRTLRAVVVDSSGSSRSSGGGGGTAEGKRASTEGVVRSERKGSTTRPSPPQVSLSVGSVVPVPDGTQVRHSAASLSSHSSSIRRRQATVLGS